jgi:alginate O-acetyltransferase complex protein AlgI
MQLSLLDLRFVILLVAVAVIRRWCPARYLPYFGAGVSAVLVGIASWHTLAVISGITLGYLYPVHLIAIRLRARGGSAEAMLVRVAIGGLVAGLAIFKVYRQFSPAFAGGLWIHDELLAWVGFSYFVLRAIGFLHIQGILGLREAKPWTLLFYMLFPPTLTSGPIQKFQDFREQVKRPQPLTAAVAAEAAYRITRGYFRKAVLAYLLDAAFKRLIGLPQMNAYSSIAAITCLYLYFYFDFAGYSDVAIGLGALMGIRVPENFRTPLIATSVSEFWRHWHITLVDWFREHVFIPLGGMQSTRMRAAALAVLIMVACGMWHGLTLAFLLWGCWHGMLLFTEAVTGSKPMPLARRHGPRYWLRVLWTDARVAFGALLFLDLKTTGTILRGFTKWI